MHEVGHLAALEHPYGDGYNSSYNQDDTVMSYNSPPDNSVNWTDSDKLAMKSIWGEDRKTFIPGRGTHTGTAFADKFYLNNFDGYGEGSADTIQGFNATNGDRLQFTTAALGWDATKQYYSFWTIENRTEQYLSGYKKKWRQGKPRKTPVYAIRTTNGLNSVVSNNNNALIYNTSSGELWVDRNGSAAGLGAGGLVGILAGAPSLTVDNIDWFAS